jgi:hypothetical protein
MPSIQERIASFPAAIVVDLKRTACGVLYGVVKPGERGYVPVNPGPEITLAELDEICAQEHNTRKPTEAERAAALFGSMFGWDVPGADPEAYTANGTPIPPRYLKKA